MSHTSDTVALCTASAQSPRVDVRYCDELSQLDEKCFGEVIRFTERAHAMLGERIDEGL